MMGTHAVLALSLAMLAACAGETRLALREPACPAAWTEQVSPDSVATACLPPGFNPGSTAIAGNYTWKRPARSPGDSDWVAVAIVADSSGHQEWPPSLQSPAACTADCYTVDSAVVHTDTIGSVEARLQTGLVTGGYEGARRAPRLVGGWITPQRSRILVVGAAELAATLDTLRAVLRTLRIRAP